MVTPARFARIAALVCALAAAGCGQNTRPEPATATVSAAARETAPPFKSGHELIDGVDYHYQVHGSGEPLLLLHGGLGSLDMFGPVLKKFAETREVIAVDLQGHGRTPLGERPFRLESMGNDMATLMKRLGKNKVDVVGYSMGAGVGFRMAVQNPDSVRRLVLVSMPLSDDSYFPELRPQQKAVSAKAAPMMKDSPMYKSYVKVAPNPNEFPRLLDTLGAYMQERFDWSGDVAKVKAETMIVYGDADMFRPEVQIKFYQLLGGGLKDAGWGREHLSQNRLAILPDATHYDIFYSPQLVPTILPFIEGKRQDKSWASQVK